MKKKRQKVKTRIVHNTNPSAYSRRVNREKKKMFKQTALFVIVAIIVFLVFIFVVIPAFFNLVTNFFDSSTPFQEVDEIAPQVPIISAPVVATSSAQIIITGFGEPESQLIVVLNGEKQDEITIADDGSFKTDITLDDGDNILTAYSRDEAKNESTLTREYHVVLDTEAPKLEILNPENESSYEGRSNQEVSLEGQTDEDAKVYVNAHIVFPDDEGKFHYTFHLHEGENLVEVVAKDKAGNSSKIELKFNFKL